MKIPAKIDYACRALLELSINGANAAPSQVAEIGKKQGIPAKFLIHIMIALKSLGYVDSVRGKSGGYVLIKNPKDICLSDVFKHFGGLGLSSGEKKVRGKKADAMQAVWDELDLTFIKALETVTFEDIVNRHQQLVKTLTYDI